MKGKSIFVLGLLILELAFSLHLGACSEPETKRLENLATQAKPSEEALEAKEDKGEGEANDSILPADWEFLQKGRLDVQATLMRADPERTLFKLEQAGPMEVQQTLGLYSFCFKGQAFETIIEFNEPCFVTDALWLQDKLYISQLKLPAVNETYSFEILCLHENERSILYEGSCASVQKGPRLSGEESLLYVWGPIIKDKDKTERVTVLSFLDDVLLSSYDEGGELLTSAPLNAALAPLTLAFVTDEKSAKVVQFFKGQAMREVVVPAPGFNLAAPFGTDFILQYFEHDPKSLTKLSRLYYFTGTGEVFLLEDFPLTWELYYLWPLADGEVLLVGKDQVKGEAFHSPLKIEKKEKRLDYIIGKNLYPDLQNTMTYSFYETKEGDVVLVAQDRFDQSIHRKKLP